MSIFSSYKKLFLLGFIVVILLAIPLSVYVAQKRQQTKTQAARSTVLSFEPANPTVKMGDVLTLNVILDPGTGSSANQVSFVKLSIGFDPEKFTTENASLTPNPTSNSLTTILEEAVFEEGKASISLSIGADPTKAVVTKTKIAILKFKTTSETASTPVVFEDDSQVLSIASSDGTSENVLLTHIPANVTISNATAGTSTSTPNPSPPTTSQQSSSSPNTSGSSSQSSFGGIGGSSGGINDNLKAPVCSSLSIDGLITGTAPYTLTFVATGSDPDGIINKISFNFGDSIEDLTVGGGIGTSTVSGQITHAYNLPGIYTAYAILTDNDGNLSTQQDNCSKTITINSDLGLKSEPTIFVQQQLPPTGPGDKILGLGILGVIFAIIGGAIFILL